MGCDASKETEKQFTETILSLNKKVASLSQDIRNLNRDITKITGKTETSLPYDTIKNDIMAQLKGLEDLIEKINQTPDPKLHSSLSRAEEDFDFTPEPEIIVEEMYDPRRSDGDYYSSFDDPTTVSAKDITEDPFIKAIVESKKKALERKKL
jgi:DNA repair exonuclease SbcCD ATPase subunit